MRFGLRTRMFLASFAVILLTLVLGGAFVGDTVRGNFSRYAHAEAEDEAYDLALYLEAWLNQSGNQEDPGIALTQFFSGQVEDFGAYEANDVEGPSWEDWEANAAITLDMPVAALRSAMLEQSLDGLCWDKDMDVEIVLAQIMRAEMDRLEEEGWSSADAVDELGAILAEAHIFLYENPLAEDVLQRDGHAQSAIPERLSWFLDSLVDDALILAIDPEGFVLFDSQGGPLGVQVSDALYESSAEIIDWRDGSEMCDIIVAAGPGHYRKEANFFLAEVQRSLLSSAAILFAAALLLSWWFSRRFLTPVQALTDATARLAQGNSDVRLPVESEDEVGRMSASFNHMLDSLEEQRALRKRLVADLAHELNTPLSVIQLELSGLETGMQSPAECATRIGIEIEVLKRLSEDVRLLTDADQGTLKLVPASCNVVTCCQEAVERWQSRAAEKQIQLEYVGASILTELQADRMRVVQVLGNLIGNAVRHCDMQGRIQVDAQIHNATDGQTAIQVSVKDNGEGIPTDQLKVIFERFTRADSARTRDSAGRGLGLAIVADIVNGHGGRVWAESEVGVGSTFRFLLPL